MDRNLRISQQSLEMEDIISELNQNKEKTHQPNDNMGNDEGFITSPRAERGDDTFAHYEDDAYSQRVSCETFTREFSPRQHPKTQYDRNNRNF